MNIGIAVKSFIVNGKGELLAIKRSGYNSENPYFWEIPGGRLNPGEDPFEGLKRETKEEVGINIKIVRPFEVRYFIRKNDGMKITMIIFLCRPLDTAVKLSKEHTEFEWLPINSAKDKLTLFYYKTIDEFNRSGLGKCI